VGWKRNVPQQQHPQARLKHCLLSEAITTSASRTSAAGVATEACVTDGADGAKAWLDRGGAPNPLPDSAIQ
jgi:hypothetical protein